MEMRVSLIVMFDTLPTGPAGFSSSLIFDFHSSVLTRCLAVIVRVRFSMYHNMRNKSSIPALFARMVTQHPNKPALIYEATGEVRTHHRLSKECSISTFAKLQMKQKTVISMFILLGLELQGSAGAMPCCGTLGAGTRLGGG